MSAKFTKQTPVIFQFRNKDSEGRPSNKGGATFVYDPAHKVVGYAFCNERDQFNKRLGVTIALGRTFKRSNIIDLEECDNEIKKIKDKLNEIWERHLQRKSEK